MIIRAITQKLKSLIRRESFNAITFDPYRRCFVAISSKSIYFSNDGENWRRVHPKRRSTRIVAGAVILAAVFALGFCVGGCTPDPDLMPGFIEEIW